MRICNKLQGMTPYSPGGRPCPVVLNANESFLPISGEMYQEMMAALAQVPLHRYPDPTSRDVTEAFAGYYGVDPALVTVGNGSDEIISLLYGCLVAKGDKVMTLEPDFSMYRQYAMFNDVVAVSWEKGRDFVIRPESVLAKAATEDPAMLIFSNPCNPTSVALPRADVIALIEGFDGIIVVDEAYMEFADESVLDLVGQYDNLIVLKTCSKALALAGLRLGYAVAPPALTRLLQIGKAPYNVNSLSQAMGPIIFRYPEEIAANIATIKEATNQLVAGVEALIVKYDEVVRLLPTSTNFLYIEVKDAPGLFQRLQDHGVLVRQMGDYLRVCAGTTAENTAFLQALEQLLKEASHA